MSLVEGSSEMGAFRDLFSDVFRSPSIQKYISYEGNAFLKIFKIESKFSNGKKKKITEYFWFLR